MNLDNIVADGIMVTKFLKDYLKKEKVYLQGHSWGTAVGINMAHRHPDLFHAYIGIGQMANSHLSEQKSYDFALAAALKAKDKKGVTLLQQIGRPPYKTDAEWLKNVMPERGILRKYEGPIGKPQKSIVDIYWTYIAYRGYSIKDKLNLLNGDAFSMQNMWKAAIKVNLFEQVPAIEIPVYIVQGKYDMHTVTEVANAYYEVLEAPRKKYFEFENSAHEPHFTEFDKYKSILLNEVLNY